MKDNWKEIIDILRVDFESNSLENRFKDHIISCLRILGWKTNNGTIEREKSLPIGNNNYIRPDILLCKDNAILPVEAKRPDNVCNERQVSQLISYMRQLKSNVGIYIGNDIRFFYDNPNDQDSAICVFKIELDENDDNGITLCELLTYNNFDKEYFELFCKEQYEKHYERKRLKERIDAFFYDGNVDNYLKNLIVELFVKEGFCKDEIEKELSEISIDINFNSKLNSYIPDNVSSVKVKSEIHKSDNKDKRKEEFSLDGKEYHSQRRFVHAVVKKYIEDHPNITFEELERAFPKDLINNSNTIKGVVVKYKEIEVYSIEHPDILNRFLIKKKEKISLNDNTIIVVYGEWMNSGDRPIFSGFLKNINCFYDYYSRDKKTNEVKYFPKNRSN